MQDEDKRTLIEKSSTESLCCLVCAPVLVPSSSAIRSLSKATCFSCSCSCILCSSTFSWAILYNAQSVLQRFDDPGLGTHEVSQRIAVLLAGNDVELLGHGGRLVCWCRRDAMLK